MFLIINEIRGGRKSYGKNCLLNEIPLNRMHALMCAKQIKINAEDANYA